MSCFVFAFISLLGWGVADMFYKLGSQNDDKYSHLKIAVWVGLVMGVCSFILIPFSETKFSVKDFFVNFGKYSPASLSYIISMVIGYAGLRYLELSIISPVQNASGALSSLVMILYLVIIGDTQSIVDAFTPNPQNILNIIGTVIIVGGVIALAVVEKKLSDKENGLVKEEKKYRIGALALLFPLLYCVFDTIGTAADGIILSEKSGLNLGEIDVLILYGITFFVAGIGCYIFMWIKTKKPYNPFTLKEIKTKGVAAVAEEFGQVFYVYAMAKNPVIAAPMIASYCIVSILLSRIFLKEKLSKTQYLCVGLVVAGIIMLGLAEGFGG